MTETMKQLDKLCSALLSYLTTAVELIPSLINMFKSTRFLTLVGTGVVMYMTWKYGGLTDGQLLVVQAAETLLGGTFMVSKTLRPSALLPAPAANPAAAGPPLGAAGPSPAAPVNTPGNGSPQYWEVPDLDKAYQQIIVANTGADGMVNWFHVGQETGSMYQERKLTNYHPDARLPLANKLSELAIAAERQVFNVVCKVAAPADYTLVGTESENEVATLVKKAKPACDVLSEADRLEIVNLGKLYDERRNIQQLVGKSVKWDQGYDTAALLGKFGIMAIG